ncbi:MAG TPA: phosphatidate cytidylyltransferase, partial [Thermoanaerobaculia bacterium]|nr:phosphatidate cytidylyltransferase [Thermoanaerobaculia bacterium]
MSPIARNPLLLTASLVAGLLVVATAVTALLQRLRPERDLSEVRARIGSWWVMAGVFLAALLLSRRAALVFFMLVCFWALREFFSLVPGRLVDRGAVFAAYAAIPLQFLFIDAGWYGMFIVFIPVYMFLLGPFLLMRTGEPKGFVVSASRIHWGLMTFVFGLSHAANLLSLPERSDAPAGGRGLLLYLVLLTELNDVFQFLSGKTFGRHRITPVISPKKTWEGFLGGVLLTIPLAAVLRYLTPLSLAEALVA